jgi:hypothetical protein
MHVHSLPSMDQLQLILFGLVKFRFGRWNGSILAVWTNSNVIVRQIS